MIRASDNVICNHTIVEDQNSGDFTVKQVIHWGGSNSTTKTYLGYNIQNDLEKYVNEQTHEDNMATQVYIKDLISSRIEDITKKMDGIGCVIMQDIVIVLLEVPVADVWIKDPPVFLQHLIKYLQDYFSCSETKIYSLHKTDIPMIFTDLNNLYRFCADL